MYIYGMKLRGYSPGCQPLEGLIARWEDTTHTYYDILGYDRELTEEEVNYYDLERIEDGIF